MPKNKGYVLYQGESRIDKKPIVAILTIESSNKKTGNMAQLWIMRDDIPPHIAKQTGADYSVCGDCTIKDQCYVLTFQGPLSVWNAYRRESYENISYMLENAREWNAELIMILSQLSIRFGAYGDPAALPLDIIKAIAENCKDFTGYTHQWKRFKSMRHYFMASVESNTATLQALTSGFRTFRIKHSGTPNGQWANEIECPADSGVQCIDCMLCNGGKQAKNITIEAHGARAGGIQYV